MRFLAIALHLFVLALIAISADPTPSYTANAPDPNPTICGNLIENKFRRFNAVDAYNCLKSIPFHPPVASKLLRYLNDTIQFHSTLAYLASPPPGYQQPAVDLVAGLTQLQHDIDDDVFRNEYDFEVNLHRLLSAAHDDHLGIKGGILSTFVFGSPYDIVSVSSDGKELPKLFIADDLIAKQRGSFAGGWEPSAISTINGRDVITYLTEFAATNSMGKLEPHADWNMLMRSGALDTQGLVEVFFGGLVEYPGKDITLTFENTSALGPVQWGAVYTGPVNTGPLRTAGDFYNFFVLGQFPASFQQSPATPPLVSQTSSPSTIPESTSPTSSDSKPYDAYPTSEIIQGVSGNAGFPRMFLLHESSVAVLSITRFESYGDGAQDFLKIVKAFLKRSKDAGIKRIVVDVQQNMGGSPILATETFKLFFPSNEPFAGSRRRAHPMADALGSIITPYWKKLKKSHPDYDYLVTDEWMIANRLDTNTGEEYNKWDDYFQSSATYGADNFTKTERYNLRNREFMSEGANIDIDNLNADGFSKQHYSAESIIILSDGICSSACALFMEMMHHEAKVRTVAVGGRPDYTPMQAPSGSRGAAVYDIQHMDVDIHGARKISGSTDKLAVDRTLGFFISSATVNLRDQMRFNDSSNTPFQFIYEAADCRIFLTFQTWYNYTNLWKYAAKAIWHDPTLCIDIPASKSFQPISSSAAFEPKTTERNRYSPNLPNRESDTALPSPPSDHSDLSNDILDSAYTMNSMKKCQDDTNCPAGIKVCREILVCHSDGSKHEKRCVDDCYEGVYNKGCPFGCCQIEDTDVWSGFNSNRTYHQSYGSCASCPSSRMRCINVQQKTYEDAFFV